jgi:hypothetical protein
LLSLCCCTFFLQEFVLREFQQVYGPHNVVAVHIVSYSPRIAKLIQQYNNTRLAIEDMLDHYSQQLHVAAAAAGRRRKRSSIAGGLAAPFVAVSRCCSSKQQLPRHQHREPLKPIEVRMMSEAPENVRLSDSVIVDGRVISVCLVSGCSGWDCRRLGVHDQRQVWLPALIVFST